MQCIMCGVETMLLKSFDRITVGFCAEHIEERIRVPAVEIVR